MLSLRLAITTAALRILVIRSKFSGPISVHIFAMVVGRSKTLVTGTKHVVSKISVLYPAIFMYVTSRPSLVAFLLTN